MAPEAWTAFGVVGAAAITAGPAYLLARARGARQESEANREAVDTTVSDGLARLHGRLDSIDHQLSQIQRWQVSHEAEHIALANAPKGDS